MSGIWWWSWEEISGAGAGESKGEVWRWYHLGGLGHHVAEFRPSGLPAQGLCLAGHILVGLASRTSEQSRAFHHPPVSLFKIRWGGEGIYKVRDVCCKILDNLENDEGENKTHLLSHRAAITNINWCLPGIFMWISFQNCNYNIFSVFFNYLLFSRIYSEHLCFFDKSITWFSFLGHPRWPEGS